MYNKEDIGNGRPTTHQEDPVVPLEAPVGLPDHLVVQEEDTLMDLTNHPTGIEDRAVAPQVDLRDHPLDHQAAQPWKS